MEQIPLVSIIIPTYNNASVVCDAINCALQQTYGNLEVLVIDDGSTDDTEQMLQRTYGDAITCIRQKNGGPGSARNTGIRHATGKYVQFLDADDLLAPDKIRIQVERLRHIPGRALSYCDYVCRDLDDSTVTYEFRHLSPRLQKENPFNDILLKWETELSIPMHCFLFDTAIFKEHAIAFDESLPTNEDWDCWMDVFALKPTVIFIDQVLAYYRMRKNSRCTDRVRMRKGHLKAIDKQIDKYRSNSDVVRNLAIRKARLKYLYRDASLTMRMIERCPSWLVPWRIRNFFEIQDKDLSSRIRGLICPD